MKLCSKCKSTKPFEEFFKTKRSKDGLASYCKICANEMSTNHRLANKEQEHGRRKRYGQKSSQQARDWKAAQGCACCSENDPVCLELHHPDPSNKKEDPANYMHWSFPKFLSEAVKCVVLCSNCHKKTHAGTLNLEGRARLERAISSIA